MDPELGSAGIGLMWGWWTASALVLPRAPVRTGTAVAAATAGLAGGCAWIAGTAAAPAAFLFATLLTLTARLLAYRALHRRTLPEHRP